MKNNKNIIIFALIILGSACTKSKEFSITVIIQHDSMELEKRKISKTTKSSPLTDSVLNKERSLLKIAVKNQTNQSMQLITRYELLSLNSNGYLNGRFIKGFALTDIYELNDIKSNEIFYTYLVYDNKLDSSFYKTPIILDKNKPKELNWLVTKFVKNKDKKIVFDSYKLEEYK